MVYRVNSLSTTFKTGFRSCWQSFLGRMGRILLTIALAGPHLTASSYLWSSWLQSTLMRCLMMVDYQAREMIMRISIWLLLYSLSAAKKNDYSINFALNLCP
jgi:hypothetical protein